MKKKVILLPLVALLVYVIMAGNSSGPGFVSGGEYTSSGCSCHNSSATATTVVQMELLSGGVPVTTYVPGTSYTVRLRGTQTSSSFTLPRFGFQAKVVTTGGSNAGTLSTALTGSTRSLTIGGHTVIEHTTPLSPLSGTGGAGTVYEINLPWTAPSAGTGGLSLRGVINAVNWNGAGSGDAGDKWNNTSTALEELQTTTGTAAICVGATTTLSNSTTGGGTWATASANISLSGSTSSVVVVTGVIAGTATVSYSAGGNVTTRVVTVNPNPTFSGSTSTCIGGSTTLGATPTGGTWSTSASTIASVSSTGVVTGLAAGTAPITYTLSTGCRNITTVTVATVPPVTGTMNVCVSAVTTLANSVTGGTWSSGTPAVATVGASSGAVTGVAPGTSIITYTSPAGCVSSATVTVNPIPGTTTGTAILCSGTTTTLANSVTGGTWTSSDGSRASVGSASGIVTGIAAGTSIITYTLPAGCNTTTVVTINASPAAITGSPLLCTGLTTTLSNSVSGGTWSTSDAAIADVDASTGVVSGIAAGTATITYTLAGGCFATTVATVNTLPGAISGTLSLCPGATSSLTNASAGGSWSSSNTSVASIGSGSGVLSAVAAGTANITYSLSAGCNSVSTVTVNPLPPATTGTMAVCMGWTTTLANSAGGGTWATTSPLASVDVSGVVLGLGAGTATITYTLSTGCSTQSVVTVNPSPASISGTASVCVGLTTTFSNTTSGGTWLSSSPATASIGSTSGIATGVAVGTSTITYRLTATGCFNTTELTVNPLPAAISGSSTVCVGATTTLTNATAGGTFSSVSGLVSVGTGGDVTGVSAGTATITYTLPTGCRTTMVITVNPLPASLAGASSVCVGSTAAIVAPTGGGTWASSDGSVATVSSSGVLTGVTAGTATITYTLGTGCYRTVTVTANPVPAASSGTAVVCVGATTTLSNATPAGTWLSTNTSVASVGAGTGVVTGVASGTSTVSYVLGTGCAAATVVTVNPLPNAGFITGASTLCVGSTTAMFNAASGGTWSTSNAAVATISAGGVVTGASAGTVTISYTVTNSCGTAVAVKTMTITVTASAGTISGSSLVCTGSTSVLTSSAGGGTWSSSNAAIASVGAASGVVSGVATGTAVISYSVSGSCGAAVSTTTVTVNAAPAAISGPATICQGSVITLTNAPGGTWSSSNVAIASAGSGTGFITGVAEGTAVITYTTPGGCTALRQVTVNPIPAPVSGVFNVCLGSSSFLTNPIPGGTWSSTNTAVASIGATSGILSGINAGTSTISYTLSTGCAATVIATVNVTPAPISGSSGICVGSSVTLTNGTVGGTWSSSNSTIATAGSATGVIVGTALGTATITYELPTGCFRTMNVTVNPMPAAVAGPAVVCTDKTITLTNAFPGGSWSSSNTAIGSVAASTGIVTGVGAGNTTISYTLPTGCATGLAITVNASPAAVTGSPSICSGSATTLASATSGGTWSSSNPSIAAVIPSTGVVVPVTLGTAVVSYTLANGCSSTMNITVNPLPAAISGPSSVCIGSSVTLGSTPAGGTWAGSTPSVASVSTTAGSVLGISAGTAMVTYTLPTGCSVTTMLTVNPAPSAITGGPGVCAGNTTTLSNSVAGGTWSSSNVALAPVGTLTGIVTGISTGTATITYTLPTGCRVTAPVTVHASPAAITGPVTVCPGASITLANATAGGTWSSSTAAVATVGAGTGVVTGVASGSAVISYVLGTGCSAVRSLSVNALPVAGTISGGTAVCVGDVITLSNPVVGGTWTSAAGNASVTADSGVVTGVTGGLDTIMYSVTNSCGTATAMHWVVINALPNAGTISGLLSLCVGSTSALSSSGGTGTWSVSNANATIGATGTVTGVTAGTSMVSYSVTNTCGTAVATAGITILPLANAGTVSGPDSVCPGSVINLTNAATGGFWAASNTNASVSPTGQVTGVLAGSVSVMYIVINSCNVDTAAKTVYVKTPAQCGLAVNPSVTVSDDLNIYPNPSTGAFTIELPASVKNGEVAITDVTGKVVASYSLEGSNGDSIRVSLADVAPGTYMVRISTADVIYRKKVVVIR